MTARKKKKDYPVKEGEELLDSSEHLLKQCEKEREEYLNGWKHAKADLINYQRNESKRIADAIRAIQEDIMYDILPVLESFDLGIAAVSQTEGGEGLERVRMQFKEVLKQRGLEEINAGRGEIFNPTRHESVGEEESKETPGTIIEEVRKGYALYGRVLRPAQVRLAKRNQKHNAGP